MHSPITPWSKKRISSIISAKNRGNECVQTDYYGLDNYDIAPVLNTGFYGLRYYLIYITFAWHLHIEAEATSKAVVFISKVAE